MIETLILAGGAVYVGLTAYRAARKKPKFALWRQTFAQSIPQATSTVPPAKPVENLGVATLSLGLATAGALAYPPLSLAAIPPLLYLTAPNGRVAWQAFRRERRISAALPSALVPLICLLNGYYVLPALGFCLLGGKQRLQRQAEANARAKLHKLFAHTGQPFHGCMSEPIIVGAGEFIPVDGVITAGSALISSPQPKLANDEQLQQVGDSVFAATLVQAGCIHIQAEKVEAQTLVAQLHQQIVQAVDSTVNSQPTADVQNALAVPLLTLGAAAALLLHPMAAVALMNSQFGPAGGDLQRLALLNFLGLAAEAGILIKAGRALTQLTQVDILVFSVAASHRPEAATVIKALRPHFSAIYVLTNSTRPISQRRLHELHADGALIADTDETQTAALTEFEQAGTCVCYVGDGVTDIAAMQAASMTISLRGSQESAVDQAQILLLHGKLYPLVTLWTLAAEFKCAQTSALQATFATGALNLASVLFFGSGLLTSYLLNTTGALASMAQVLLPAVENEPQQLGGWLWNEIRQTNEVVTPQM